MNDSYKTIKFHEDDYIPDETHLGASYPNPFNTSINIPLYLNKTRNVKVDIFNLQGNQVSSHKYHLNAGRNILKWSGKNHNGLEITSGVYFITLSWKNGFQSQKILCLK